MKGAVCRISLSGLRVAPNKYATIQYPLRLSFSLPYYVNPPLLSGNQNSTLGPIYLWWTTLINFHPHMQTIKKKSGYPFCKYWHQMVTVSTGQAMEQLQ